jgi:hypothetical protein
MSSFSDTSFSYIYTGKDSLEFFRVFVSSQDEAIMPWNETVKESKPILQQKKTEEQAGKSLFTESLASKTTQPLARNTGNSDWLSGVLLLLLILITWTYVSNRKRMEQIFRAAFSYRFVNQLLREGDLSKEMINTALSICYLLSTSLLIVLTSSRWGGYEISGFAGVLHFLQVLTAISLLFIGRISLHRFTGFVFKTQSYALEYNVNTFLINHITTICILPFLMIAFYTESVFFLSASLLIFCVLLVYSIFRGSIIGTTITKFPVFYLFLYLCTLEILPLLVIVKVVEMKFL